MNGGVGVIRVLSDAQGRARVHRRHRHGPVPVDIKDVKAGEHIVQVKAPGFTDRREEGRRSPPGSSQIVKFDLNAERPRTTGHAQGRLDRSPRPPVFIDGAAVGKVPQEKKSRPGEHPSCVRLDGYKQFEQKVRVEPGQSLTVQADLKAVGRLRILSTPAGATVLINGVPRSARRRSTPRSRPARRSCGSRWSGFKPFEQTLTIEGGKTQTISRELAIAGKSRGRARRRAARPVVVRRAHAAARPLDGRLRRRLSVLPRPARITVGAGRIAKQFGFDANVARAHDARAHASSGSAAARCWSTTIRSRPAAFTEPVVGQQAARRLGAQRRDVGPRRRRVADRAVARHDHRPRLRRDVERPPLPGARRHDDERVRGHGSDRDLQGLHSGRPHAGRSALDPSPQTTAARRVADRQLGSTSSSATTASGSCSSIVAEIAVQQRWNVYGILEGAPFQAASARCSRACSRARCRTPTTSSTCGSGRRYKF